VRCRRGEIPLPEATSPRDGGFRLPHQKAVNARDHLGGQVALGETRARMKKMDRIVHGTSRRAVRQSAAKCLPAANCDLERPGAESALSPLRAFAFSLCLSAQ